MGSALVFDDVCLPDSVQTAVKLLVVGHFTVVKTTFVGTPTFAEDELREALDLLPETLLVTCDARDRRSSAQALISLVQYLRTRTTQEPA